MNASDYDYVDDPTVAVADDGSIVVAWVDQARQDIFLQTFAEDGTPRLAAPVNVSRTPDVFSWLPRVVLTAPDARQVSILWQEIVFSGGSHGGEIFFAQSKDAGQTFSPPLNLSRSLPGDGKGRLDRERWDNGSLDLAADGEGNLYAAWTEYDGRLWLSRSRDGGQTFSTPLHLTGGPDASPVRAPSLALGRTGEVLLAWTVGEEPSADIQVARSTDGGRTFHPPVRADRSAAYSDAPKMTVDEDGTVHLVFWDGAFAEHAAAGRIRYTRSRAGAPAFEAPRDLGSGSFPNLSVDADGAVDVVWELASEGRARSLGIASSHSADGGQTFSAPAILPGTDGPALGANGWRQGRLMSRLDANARGSVAVGHSTFREGHSSHVWLVRGERR